VAPAAQTTTVQGGAAAAAANDPVGSDNAQQGRGYKKMHGHGHKKMHGHGQKHGSHSDMEGSAFADGSDMGVTGVGLQAIYSNSSLYRDRVGSVTRDVSRISRRAQLIDMYVCVSND
jgi:hypothetical protein